MKFGEMIESRRRSFPKSGRGGRGAASMRAKGLDKKFDKGEDVSKYLDLSRASRPGRDQKRVNVDLPKWMIESLDKEARRLGVTRQSIIKVWLTERLQKT